MLPDTQLTPVNGGRRERRRRETHARIFDAAMRLFSERGYANTPVEEITEAADVAKGTFFNDFPEQRSDSRSLG